MSGGGGGSFVHGDAFTFTAAALGVAGFGTKATAAPVLWDNITNSGYGTVTDGTAVPVGGSYPWAAQRSTNVVFSTGTTRANSKPTYTANGADAALENDARARTKTGYAYVSWWFRPATTTFSDGSNSAKFIRMSDSRSLTNMTFSWTQQQSYIFDAINSNVQTGPYGQYAANNWHGPSMTGAAWNFVELWFNTPSRQYTIRVNGSAIVNASSWDADSDFDANVLWLLGWENNTGLTLQWWLDCVYHDNSLARVMLGNASTYAACTAFEMQPPTAWANDSITVTANRGAAASGSTRYLYVVNSSGSVVNSTGYSLTVN